MVGQNLVGRRFLQRAQPICSTGLLLGCSILHALCAAEEPGRALQILEHRCLSCHNDIDQQGDLSFATRDSMLESGLIESGSAAASHLITVVTSQDGAPPEMPKDSNPLHEDEVELLRTWIDGGANWPHGYRLQEPANQDFDWWSWKPLKRPNVPQFAAGSREADWVQTPIDAFVAEQHRAHGLVAAPRADRRTLVRRLYFDLTGLPPTPDEVQNFMESDDPAAWSQLVDRLLNSERYGERWARHWLDVVKYADTCGYDKDKLRPHAWPYRDYVIDSFNADKPYSRFVQEQLAGDVLFPGESDAIRALGFIAAGPWDFIGHAEVSEDKIDGKVARNLDRDDMVSNTLNTFCSITIQCARCHNHKFDPFTQEHYYSLQSIFAAVDKADRVFDSSPEIEAQRRTLTARLQSAERELRDHEQSIVVAGGQPLIDIRKRIESLVHGRREQSRPVAYGYHSQIATTPDTSKWVEVDLGQAVPLSVVRLRACSDDFAGIGAGFGFPVRFRLEGATGTGDTRSWRDLADRETTDVSNPGLAPLELKIAGAPVRYVRITASQLAERSKDYIFALAELEAIDTAGRNRALGRPVVAQDSIEAPGRWSRHNLTDGKFPLAENPQQAIQLAAAEARSARLISELKSNSWREGQLQLRKKIADIRKQREQLPEGQLVYAAATHFKTQANFKPTQGQPRPVHLLHRGNVTQPRDEVMPGVVPLHDQDDWQLNLPRTHLEGERRAQLARWVTRDDHPLTWRSIVNRIWQYHFGEALVPSPNDFGRMGQSPTHPALLDWLAVEFRDNGQSFRKLHQLILESAAWQQSSGHHPAHAEIDASNRYLWKHARRRLSAEELRDSMLAVSGRLNLTMGGPGFYLFALEKTDHSPHYEYHKFDPTDSQSHRRSIYRFIVRSQPDPFMTTLDCADSSQSTPRRTETFTALQALSLLNNDFTLVMADAFSERLQEMAGTTPEIVDAAFLLCSGRLPAASERAPLIHYTDSYGIAATCRVLFNLNEFIFVD